MSALFCLFLCFGSYSEKLEEYISTFYKIRYILEELYVAVIPIISRLIIYIDQLNEGMAHDISKEFLEDSHFENTTAGFLLRCQNLLRLIPPKMMHFQAWKKMILTNIAL